MRLNSQSPKFRNKFSRYKQYSKATIDQVLTPEDLKEALILEANHMESSFIENLGGGKFSINAFADFSTSCAHQWAWLQPILTRMAILMSFWLAMTMAMKYLLVGMTRLPDWCCLEMEKVPLSNAFF